MPKVIDYTPAWLTRPSPGFKAFDTSQTAQPERNGLTQKGDRDGSNSEYAGPHRTIAQRGTEVFIATGTQLRWTDLVSLKEIHQQQLTTPSKSKTSDKPDEGPEDGSYRILKVPIGEQIRQLAISPNGNLLAIATSHTVHIVILPDSSLLGQLPNKNIKLKSYTVGPTAHVLSQYQVTNILWHSCGAGGNCLVTVTADAVVRLWEFNREDRSSASNPSLAIDLKKLVNASSEEQSFAPDKFERNRSFSSDNVGLEVASACFGGSGSDDESAWSAMTLWVAMKGGDVYALCPLLPSKWQASDKLIESLLTVAVTKDAQKEGEGSLDTGDKRSGYDQLQWIGDIDGQDPMTEHPDVKNPVRVYRRPNRPGPVPRLQGPFQLSSEEMDEELELSDIHVIASKRDSENSMSDDDSDSEPESVDEEGLSASVIVLLTRIGRSHVCVDLEGVEGQWLPHKKPKRALSPLKDPYLVLLEVLDTLTSSEQLDLQWPTFSQDVKSRYSVFITHGNGIFYLSFEPWIDGLEKELHDSEKLGAPLRMDLIRNGPETLRERILSFQEDDYSVVESEVSACLVFHDSDIGYFLLTSVNGYPEAVTFNDAYPLAGRFMDQLEDDEEETEMPDMSLLTLGPARTSYQPAGAFWVDSSLARFVEGNVPHRHKQMMKEPVRLSTATLDLMTQAHRILSQETHRLGLAASDLFRRCDRLREELSDQVSRVNELAHRTDKVAGDDADDYRDSTKAKNVYTLGERLDNVQRKQDDLTNRYENLRRKFNSAGGRELSSKEKLWAEELKKATGFLHGPPNNDEDSVHLASESWQRSYKAKTLAGDLIERASQIHQDSLELNGDGDDNGNPDESDDDEHMIPDDARRLRLAQVTKLLRAQTDVVEEAQKRLRGLNAPLVTS